MIEKIKLLGYILLIPIIGAISALFFEAPDFYLELNKPIFAPPGWLFPVAWGILYALLGAFLYFIIKRKDVKSITVYVIQMVINLIWCFVFFNFQMFTLAYIMIIIMIVLTAVLIYLNKTYKSVYVLVPYILWLLFASYLNLAIIILN